MNNKAFYLIALLISMPSYADFTYNGVNVRESSIEQDLREKVACLAGNDTSDCALTVKVDQYFGEITGSNNGSVHRPADHGIDLSAVESVTVRYSGGAYSSTLPAIFDLKQDCSTVQSLLMEQYAGQLPQGVSGAGVTGFGENVQYNCQANDNFNVVPDSISALTDKWSKPLLIEELPMVTKQCIWEVEPDTWIDIYRYYCEDSSFGSWGRHSPQCNTSTIKGDKITCTYRPMVDVNMGYEGRYIVDVVPQNITDSSVVYHTSTLYRVEGRRLDFIEGYDPLVPIMVGDITIFVHAIRPDLNTTNSTPQFTSTTVAAPKRNNAEFSFGCRQHKFNWPMNHDAFSYVLEKDELNFLSAKGRCENTDLSLAFSSISNADDLFWKISYSFTNDEKVIWRKYADFLALEIEDRLLDAQYIGQLQAVAQQSIGDTQLVIKTLSSYILGTSGSILPSGVKGFLEESGTAWGIDSPSKVQQELARITTDSANHKYGLGALIVDDAPDYWKSFVRSHYAAGVDYYKNGQLLTMAKNIIDASNGGEDTTTLRDEVAQIAELEGIRRTEVIAKTEKFLDVYVAQRSDLKDILCEPLNRLRSAVGSSTETCAN